MERFAPRNEAEAAEAVAAALANGTPLEILGTGSKRALGRPVSAAMGLSSAAMMGVSLYEPSELVLRAASGTPIRSIVDLLNQRGQELAFEPMDYGPLFGKEQLCGTIGGLIAVNASGPRRIKAGAARDHLLGFRAVSGRGEIFQSGGRVMKNVTGYDLSKLMTGSFGTLAFLTEITLKVLPKAPSEETLIATGLSDEAAISLLTEASGLPHEASGFAHLPPQAAASLSNDAFGAATALRLEGPDVSIAKRKQELIRHFRGQVANFQTMDEPQSKKFWAAVRDVLPLAALNAHIWRISTAPAAGASTMSRILRSGVRAVSWYYDWAGGLIWLATEAAAEDTYAAQIRAALAGAGGHATLIRAPESVRSQVPVFHPQPAALAALSAKVKDSFDPERILNRGRLQEDL